MAKRLAKKTIVVTGAASGIGKAVCDLALNEGAFVIGVDSDFKNEPTKFKKIEGDVRSKLTIEKVRQSIDELHGLALIAGISKPHTPIDQGTSEDWDNIFDVNIKSNWTWLNASPKTLMNEVWRVRRCVKAKIASSSSTESREVSPRIPSVPK